MRATGRVWARLESKGRPHDSVTIEDESVAELAKAIARWLLSASMGHYMRITIARSAEDLQRAVNGGGSGAAKTEDLLDEIDSMLAGLEDEEGE